MMSLFDRGQRVSQNEHPMTFDSASARPKAVRTLALVPSIIGVLLMASSAAAQTLVTELDAAPRAGQSGFTGTVGASLQQGAAETRGWTVGLTGAHTTSAHALVRVDFTSNYADYRRTSSDPYLNVSNNELAKFTYLHPLPHRLGLLGLASWRRDEILQLDYRAEAEAGLGATLVESKDAYLMVGGSFSVGRQSRKYTTVGEDVHDIGLLAVGSYHFTPTFGASGSIVLKRDLGDSNGRTSAVNLAVMAMVAKHLGMKVYYQHQYDYFHAPGVSASQSQVGVGLQVSFGAKAGSTPQP